MTQLHTVSGAAKHFLGNLDKLPVLPLTAKLFTSDATSMYTNIDPDEGILVLRKYLNEFGFNGEQNSQMKQQTEFICDLTNLVMTTNVFKLVTLGGIN